MKSLAEFLAGPEVLLMDGAMGTQLLPSGNAAAGDCERLNVACPEQVARVHAYYVTSGAQCLLTNTFQANAAVLREPEVLEVAVQGALQLARRAIGQCGYVLADIGPIFQGQAESLRTTLTLLQTVDGYLFETWSDLKALREALDCFRTIPGVGTKPLIVSFAFRAAPQPQTFHGHSPEECAELAESMGAVAVGMNCGLEIGGRQGADILGGYRARTNLPLLARLNAGTPSPGPEGRLGYPREPMAWSNECVELIRVGARMLGGCCGTTPEHIRRLAERLREQKSPPQ